MKPMLWITLFALIAAIESPLVRAGSSENPVVVESLDPGMNVKSLHGYGEQIQPVPPAREDAVPAPETRNKVFAEAGLTSEELKSLDELAKDLLFFHAGRWDLQKLSTAYPFISASHLKNLKLQVADVGSHS
jgi:hypothetical protein